MSAQPTTTPVPSGAATRDLSPGLQALVGRLLADPEFRRAVARDPERAVATAGIALTPEELERLRTLPTAQREQLAASADTRDSRGWWLVILGWFWWW
ncbi:MAG TPA: Os1348 family NHLP clan protein [Chloroflexota bacterium]|nr:Os1348 family NHLP clan protein [Chloroflexota bacterium]